MVRKVLIHTRNLSIPGGKQSYLSAIEKYFKNNISYFFYGTQTLRKQSVFLVTIRLLKDYISFYRLIKKGNYDIVHINTSFNFKSYFRDSVFTLISAILKVKTIVFWHGWRWDFETKYARKILPFFHFTFGRADAMVCLANEFIDCLKSYNYKKPIYLESTVVDDSIMNHSNGNGSLTNESVKKDNTTILVLSRIEKGKGLYEVVDSFQNLQNSFPNVVLSIAGAGNELSNLKKYVNENQLKNINFLGWIDGDEKIDVLFNSDIFVLASYSEGMPICILEAMACGKPVVTTDVGGVKDFFKDGQMGHIVKVKDSIDLEKKLEILLSNPEMSALMGNYNKNYAKKQFSAHRVAKRLEDIFEEVLQVK